MLLTMECIILVGEEADFFYVPVTLKLKQIPLMISHHSTDASHFYALNASPVIMTAVKRTDTYIFMTCVDIYVLFEYIE